MRSSTPYIFIIGVALFMFRGIFAPGFMSGYDNSLHFYDTYYLTNTLIPEYHWTNGWSMQTMAGLPIFIDYFQLVFLFIALFNILLHIPLIISYKIMVLFSYIFLGAGFYKVSSYRFGKMASLIIAICIMLQKDIYFDRILGGVWNNYLGIGLLLIFLHLFDKNVKALTIRKSASLGLILGILILTHLFAAIFGFLILIIYAIPYLMDALKEKALLRKSLLYMFIPTLAFMAASYYLHGFIVTKNYFSIYPYKETLTGVIWSLKSFFGPFEPGRTFVSTFMLNAPVIVRIAFSFFGIFTFINTEKDFNIRRFLTYVTVFIFVSLIFFSDILVNFFDWWHKIPFIGNLQTSRFLIYAQIGMYIFAAYGLAKFLDRFKSRKIVTTSFFTLLLASLFFHYTYFACEGSKTLEESPHMADIFKVWDWIGRNVPAKKVRIVYQNTIGNIDDSILARSDVFALSGIFTKVPQIGVSRSASPFPQEKYMRNDHGRIFGKELASIDDTFIKETMNYFNAEYIVSVEPNLRAKLEKSEEFFKEEDFGPFSIFRLMSFKGGWIAFAKDAQGKTEAFENQRLVFEISNESSNNEAFVKVSYHPLWKAYLNQRPVEILQDRYSFMRITLPEKGTYRLVLSFNSFNAFWVAVSSLSLITGACFIMGRI